MAFSVYTKPQNPCVDTPAHRGVPAKLVRVLLAVGIAFACEGQYRAVQLTVDTP